MGLTRFWQINCKEASSEELREVVHELGDLLVTKVRHQEIEYKGSIISKKSLTPKSLVRKRVDAPAESSCC